MYNTFTPERRVNLNVRLAAAPPPDPQAWKKFIGAKPVAARLEVLPEGKSRMSSLATSVVFQAIVTAFVVSLPLFFPDALKNSLIYQVVPLAPIKTEFTLPEAPKPQPVRRAELRPKPQPVAAPVPPAPVLTRRVVFAPAPMIAKLKPVEVNRTQIPASESDICRSKAGGGRGARSSSRAGEDRQFEYGQ